MLSHFAAFLLFSLVGLSWSLKIPEHHDHHLTWEGHGFDANVTKRATGKTITDLFTIDMDSDDDGGCKSKETVLNNWLAEANLLHTAALKAYGSWESDGGSRRLLEAWLGVTFEYFDGWEIDDESAFSTWPVVGNRLAAVTAFLAGDGLSDPVTSTAPYFFCSIDFAESAQWDQPAMDSLGKPFATDEAKTEYVKLQEVFKDPESKGWTPYYVSKLHAYTFDSGANLNLCVTPKGDRNAATSKRTPNDESETDLEIGTYDRFIYFCERGFDPASFGGVAHSVQTLAESVTSSGYPTSTDANKPQLDKFLPISATFYHELFHSTDSAQTTGDPYYGLKEASDASIDGDLTAKKKVVTNPESFVYFAMAAYLYQNAPAGSTTLLFARGGLGVDAAKEIASSSE